MTPHRRGILVILDGLGDRPVEALARATPLEAARTPILDALVTAGLCGLVDPLTPGIPVDTATGTGLLLGASPRSITALARGPVEAAGVGLEIAPGDLALRCNFATLERTDGQLVIRDRRAGRIRTGTGALASALENIDLGDGIRATLRPATQHRAVLRLTGHGLSAEISDTDPGAAAGAPRVLRSKARHRDDPRAARTAAAVNRFVEVAHERLTDHEVNRERARRGRPPANGVITRGAGLATTSRSLLEQLGLRATVVAGESTVLGLAALLEMESITRPGFTGLSDTDVAGKVAAGLDALDRSDVVFIHVKAPDICAHDFDPEAKRDFLERLDGELAALVDRDVVIGVTGDHSSDSTTGSHSGDPVPALLRGPGARVDETTSFGERAAMTGGLGRLSSSAFLMAFLDTMGAVPEWRSDAPAFDLELP